MASMGEFQGKNYCWPKRTETLIAYLPKHITMILKPKIFCGQTKVKFSFLDSLSPVASGTKLTQPSMSGHLRVPLSSTILCSRTMIWNEWFKKQKMKVLESPSQSQVSLRCFGMTLNRPCSKTFQCNWIKRILRRRVRQHFSTVMWKSHCQLSQTLACNPCCQGWHNLLLCFGSNYFHTGSGEFGKKNSLNKGNNMNDQLYVNVTNLGICVTNNATAWRKTCHNSI